MNTKPVTESNNPVLAGSWPALKRAAERAKRISELAGTRLIVSTKKAAPRAPKSVDTP